VPSADGADPQASLSALQQLEAAQKALEALKLRYTADHPDVRRMERGIAELKVKVEQEATRRPERRPVDRVPSSGEQVRQKRIRDLQADLDAIDRQLAASQSEEGRLKSVLAAYQRKIDVVPRRESELVELTRDYETLKKGYDSLLTKREDSTLAANLERRQIGEQFRILDPASLPSRPANQARRLAFSFAGAGAGLVLGLLLAAFLDYRDSSFNREEEIHRVLELPVLAVVPTMSSEPELHQQVRRRIAADLAGAVVLTGSAALLIMWAVREL
jgi:uncharacterized protein involved in exopolysaccharide biosynthesis